MLTVEESIVIDRPRMEVWEFMTDPENVPVYNANVVEYEVTSGSTHEVGRRCHGVVRVAGRKLELNDELVEVEPGVRGRLVSEDATIPYTLELSYAEEGDSTRVTWHQEMESLNGVFKFADPIVLKLYARDVRNSLDKIKTLLES